MGGGGGGGQEEEERESAIRTEVLQFNQIRKCVCQGSQSLCEYLDMNKKTIASGIWEVMQRPTQRPQSAGTELSTFFK